MSNINNVMSDVQHFQASVKKLSVSIKDAGVNWHDEKHAVLSKMVSRVASSSKGVMAAADKLSSDFKKFESVAAR